MQEIDSGILYLPFTGDRDTMTDAEIRDENDRLREENKRLAGFLKLISESPMDAVKVGDAVMSAREAATLSLLTFG